MLNGDGAGRQRLGHIDLNPEPLQSLARFFPDGAPANKSKKLRLSAEADVLGHAELLVEALRLEDRRELLKGRKQDRRERKRYAELVFRLVCWWLAGVMALVCAAGFETVHLDEGVLLAIVGSTTASVVAIFVVVAKYLFPPRS